MICGYLPELHNGSSSSRCHFLSSIESDLFKNSCFKSLPLPIQRYYFLYIIYYQHCHIDRESIFRRAKTSVVVATPSLSVVACASTVVATLSFMHPVGANVNDVPF